MIVSQIGEDEETGSVVVDVDMTHATAAVASCRGSRADHLSRVNLTRVAGIQFAASRLETGRIQRSNSTPTAIAASSSANRKNLFGPRRAFRTPAPNVDIAASSVNGSGSRSVSGSISGSAGAGAT